MKKIIFLLLALLVVTGASFAQQRLSVDYVESEILPSTYTGYVKVRLSTMDPGSIREFEHEFEQAFPQHEIIEIYAVKEQP